MTTIVEPALDPITLSEEEVGRLNEQFERADPGEILRWAAETLPAGRVALTSTFALSAAVMLPHIARLDGRIHIIFIDTLYHFPETLEHAERMRELYDLDLRIYRPAESREAFEAEHGTRLWERDEERYHRLTKVEPMRRALETEKLAGWINGRRRDQSSARQGLPILERHPSFIKINPMATWNLDRIWAHIREHNLPYNPLHDQGYASIGDAPLTTPVLPGESERAGRWRGGTRLECGMHHIT